MPGGSQKFAGKFWACFKREFYCSAACLQEDATAVKAAMDPCGENHENLGLRL